MPALERKPEVPTSPPDEEHSPSRDCRGIPRDPLNSHGDWTFLRTHQRVPLVLVLTRKEPQACCHTKKKKKKKKQEIHPLTQTEALFRCSVSRGMPPSLLGLEWVLDTLEATQKVHRYNNLHSRGTPRIPPQLKKSAGFPSSSQEEGPFPCFVRKGIPGFPSHLKRVWPHLTLERNSRGLAIIPKDPDVTMYSR